VGDGFPRRPCARRKGVIVQRKPNLRHAAATVRRATTSDFPGLRQQPPVTQAPNRAHVRMHRKRYSSTRCRQGSTEERVSPERDGVPLPCCSTKCGNTKGKTSTFNRRSKPQYKQEEGSEGSTQRGTPGGDNAQ